MPRKGRQAAERRRCFYCGDPILGHRLEEDHFPVPQSCGGTQTVPACPQCHDLKDRTSWEDLPLEFKAAFLEQFEGMSREAKIVLAQFMRVAFESRKHPAVKREGFAPGDVLEGSDGSVGKIVTAEGTALGSIVYRICWEIPPVPRDDT